MAVPPLDLKETTLPPFSQYAISSARTQGELQQFLEQLKTILTPSDDLQETSSQVQEVQTLTKEVEGLSTLMEAIDAYVAQETKRKYALRERLETVHDKLAATEAKLQATGKIHDEMNKLMHDTLGAMGGDTQADQVLTAKPPAGKTSLQSSRCWKVMQLISIVCLSVFVMCIIAVYISIRSHVSLTPLRDVPPS